VPLINITQLAKELDYDRAKLYKLANRPGSPRAKDREGRNDLYDVDEWREYLKDLSEEEEIPNSPAAERKKLAEAKLKELDLLERKRDLAVLGDYLEDEKARLKIIVKRLHSLSISLPPKLSGASDDEIKTIIRGEFDYFLEDIRNTFTQETPDARASDAKIELMLDQEGENV
jgi:hypothetical protein